MDTFRAAKKLKNKTRLSLKVLSSPKTFLAYYLLKYHDRTYLLIIVHIIIVEGV